MFKYSFFKERNRAIVKIFFLNCLQKITQSNSQFITHSQPVSKLQNDKQISLKSDPETIAALTQLEERRDYYHTCINGGY
jgi:hypothetical protein